LVTQDENNYRIRVNPKIGSPHEIKSNLEKGFETFVKDRYTEGEYDHVYKNSFKKMFKDLSEEYNILYEDIKNKQQQNK